MNASLSLAERDGLPETLRVLLDAYPRPSWETHPNFGDLVQFWLQRHVLFRQLTDVLTQDAEQLMDGNFEFEAYAKRLSHYGGTLLNELHAHHQI